MRMYARQRLKALTEDQKLKDEKIEVSISITSNVFQSQFPYNNYKKSVAR